MQFTIYIGQTFPLLNIITQETAEFQVLDLGEYRGKWIVYGTTSQHGISVARGVQAVQERPGCFVFLADVKANLVHELTRRLNGTPLALVDGAVVGLISGRSAVPANTYVYPVLNAGPLYGDPALEAGYQQGHRDKASMMRKASRLVDVWVYWTMNQKRLPPWCKTTPPHPTMDTVS